MPPVDLTAILPALKEAVAPFEIAYDMAKRTHVHPTTMVRNYAPLGTMPLAQVDKLVEAVQAVRRMAGDLK